MRAALVLLVLGSVAHAEDLEARYRRGLGLRAHGQKAQADAIWNSFYDDYEQGRIDKKSARQLTYVALAARWLGGWKDANDTFRDAVDADPKGKDGARANIEWAALFLEKYDAGHAEQSLDEALKILPDDPEAHYLMARVKLEQSYDLVAAHKEIAFVLKKNPKHAGAKALEAELLVDDERYDDAIKLCATLAGDDLRVRTVAAAARWFLDDTKGFEAEKKRALEMNPMASEFFHGIAEFLVKQHRYPEASELEAQALKANPKDWVALAALGANELRLGHEDKGLDALRRAWDGDPYNVRTYNLLNLFEQVIPKKYVVVETTPFRIRVTQKDRALVERYVVPMLRAEYPELVKRYGFTPQGPLTMELYDNNEHYAVRTIGLPGLEALGVTFGQVITAMSPSIGRFNWGMTLWHEVAHVFAIQMSKWRVPRWFTEGLSEYETARARPEWTRRTHAELYRALADGKLLSVAELDSGFTHARDVSHIVIAYHQSSEMVQFLIRRWGFPKAVEALKLFGAGRSTREVIPAVTGLSVEKFDAAFRDDLRVQLKPYDGTFFVRQSDYSDVDALKERIAKNPKDLRAKGLYALALVHAHRGEEAQKLYDEAQKVFAQTGNATNEKQLAELKLAVGLLAVQRKDWDGAKLLFGQLIRDGDDGFDARFGLGQAAAATADLVEAEKQLTLAKKMDPDRADPYTELAKLYLKMKRDDDAIRELEEAAKLDCMDPSIAKLLVVKYAAKKNWKKVAELAPLALYINPFDLPTHTELARALVELHRNAEALDEIDAASKCDPDGDQKAELRELELKAGRI
jgi:tetratricopeptide (TPR) repeat protein